MTQGSGTPAPGTYISPEARDTMDRLTPGELGRAVGAFVAAGQDGIGGTAAAVAVAASLPGMTAAQALPLVSVPEVPEGYDAGEFSWYGPASPLSFPGILAYTQGWPQGAMDELREGVGEGKAAYGS